MIAIIGDPDTAAGFRLGGVKEVYEYSPEGGEDAARALDKLAKENVAIIIVNERVAADARIREKIKEINTKKKGVIPIIIEVPDKEGPMKKEIDEIGLLIKRAVGIAVK
jgi:V/A-type H+-transporting ATPase subunit F